MAVREADGDGHDSESDPWKKYGLFRNASAKFMSAEYCAALKGENGEDDDIKEDVLDSTVLYIATLDQWIMTVLKCLGCADARGVQRQKKYVETFQEYVTIEICQRTREMNNFGKEQDSDDLTIPERLEKEVIVGGTEQEAK